MQEDTITDIKKVTGPRHHKVNNSLGVYDAYRWYRKNKPKDKKYVLTSSQYFKIIRTLNQALAQQLIDKGKIVLPERLGIVEIKKYTPTIKLENNKVKTNLPIDWNATVNLWCEDKECKQNKTLVRKNVAYVFKIRYDKTKANYNNKSFYQFTPNRQLKIALKDVINNNPKYDAFIL